jgi:hypothetical protein
MLPARTINFSNCNKCTCCRSNRTIVAPKVVSQKIDESVVLGIYKKFNLDIEHLQTRKFEE